MPRFLMLAAATLGAALSIGALGCGNKASSDAAAGEGDYADVDCDKMSDHNIKVMIASAPAEKRSELEAGMKAKRDDIVKACNAEKSTKRLTKTQYSCILAAESMEDLAACVKK